MKHVLENIRVVEIGGYIVGSFCATLLADMGANVIKVESFSGDGLRGLAAAFQGYNRGKRGIAVNLRTDEGKKIVKQLINDSDVLVQNLRHGVTTQLQIDYKDVYEYNPGIIYLAMPGYGQSGPYVTKPAFDPLLQAMSGVMAAQGGRGAAPVYLRAAIGDYSGALLGAFGVAMALYNFVEIDDYYLGKMKQMGIPIILAEHPASIKNPAPRWGQHTTRVLSDFGFQKREITELKKKGIIG